MEWAGILHDELRVFCATKKPHHQQPTNQNKTNKQKTQKSKPQWLRDGQTRITSEHNSNNFKISELILNYSPECILNIHADIND